MAAAGTLIAMLAQVAGHRYGFEFWGIRTASLVDSQARLLHWSVTGRAAPDGAKVAGAEVLAAPDRTGGGRGSGIGPHRRGQGGIGQGGISQGDRSKGADPSRGVDRPRSPQRSPGPPASLGAAQRRATGLTGEPRALVKGSGVASSRKS